MTIPRRALAGSLLLAMVAVLAPPAPAQPRAPRPPRPAASDSQPLLRALEDAVVSVADRATPSVVNVSVKVRREAAPGAAPPPGKGARGWLGVVVQDLDPELAAGSGAKEDAGVLVADVIKEGPGAAAGLKPGDVIVAFGGTAIKDVPDLQKRVAAVEPGRTIPLTVLRERKTIALRVRVGEQPTGAAMAAAEGGEEALILGLAVEPLTPETARRHDLTAPGGLLVTEVAPGSAGAAAGIKPGDAVLEVNRQPVRDAAGFRQAVGALPPGEPVPVYLQRGGGLNEYVMLTAPSP